MGKLWIDSVIWFGLFAATAATDFLATRWLDATTPHKRAWIAAVHEAVGLIAGFTVFTVFQTFWMALPCILGAWVGSYIGGVNMPPDSLEADLVVACERCGGPFLNLTNSSFCPNCAYEIRRNAEKPEPWQGTTLKVEDRTLAGQPTDEDD